MMARCEICGQEQMGVYHDCKLSNESMIESDIINYLRTEDGTSELKSDVPLLALLNMGKWLVANGWRKMTDPLKEND